MRFVKLICLIAGLLPTAGFADAQKARKLADSLPGEASVGRLMVNGNAMCTGALVSPDLVLTAAHCLYDPNNGRRVKPHQIEFQAGLRKGKAVAVRKVRSATQHPQYRHVHKGTAQVGHDLALLRLVSPIDKNAVLPMAQDIRLGSGDMLGVLSYNIGNRNDPVLEYPCRVLATQHQTVVMSCDVDFGASGAPVLALSNGKNPALVSVVSARAAMGGRTVSVGTTLTTDALQKMMRGG
ncbi:V8-like Glu-specific endopeptidase [Shimia isoporae]|uniref:V8-like Glu-specific endopeptidase n=1 Tax=Shimia isoporae TaxID=647720 RepID=A0A4R1NL60_9RHOB|nr:trypsin-like serine protease [Shimia isoporae]TCL09077.1 V8-like Glu-specific endopeptidase [Shimia isoporae]